MKITMQPFYCDSDYTGADTTGCLSDITEKVTIFNKHREFFQLEVGAGLALKNLIIDSLDSIVDSTETIPSCLSSLMPCCKIDTDSQSIVAFNSSVDDSVCDITKN